MAKKFLTNIDANNNDIVNADSITFNTATTDTPNAAGKVVWDNGEGTLAYGLKGGTIDLQIGSENVALCTNNTGSTITKGKVVYINGASGQRPTIALADADSDATSAQTFGVTTQDIANGAEGFVCTYGILKNVDTSAFTAGQILYLSSTPGGVTTTKPVAPVHLVYVGYVISVNASSGRIFVKPQNGYELDELHDVLITSPANNDFLVYETSSTLWKNKSASTLDIIQDTIVDAKGDLIAATAADTVSRLAVGANGTVLTADSAEATGLKWASPPAVYPYGFGHTSQVYYTTVGAATVNEVTSVSANNNYYMPFWVPETATYDRIAMKSGSGTFTGTTTIRLGIYNNNSDGRPGSLVLDAGTIAFTTANSVQSITISQTLTAGMYWLVCNPQSLGTAYSLKQLVGTGFTAPGVAVVTSPGSTFAGENWYYSQGSVTGALPSTASTSPSSRNNIFPVMIRKA